MISTDELVVAGILILGYLAIGAAFLKVPSLRCVRVFAARNYARYCMKLYYGTRRNPWVSPSQIREYGLLAEEALQDASDLLEDLEAESPFRTVAYWPDTLAQAIRTAWDTNEICEIRRLGVVKRLSLRNLRTQT